MNHRQTPPHSTSSIYNQTITLNTGDTLHLSSLSGGPILIVNTASKCGFTKQYEGLENLYSRYKDKGFEILGFPCDQFGHQEPGSDEEIAAFCNINFGVSFSLFKKTDVNGPQTHPMYVELKDQAPGLLGSKRIKWNFTKFLSIVKAKAL